MNVEVPQAVRIIADDKAFWRAFAQALRPDPSSGEDLKTYLQMLQERLSHQGISTGKR